MVELIAKSACKGLPLQVGALELSEDAPAAITSVMPFAGQEVAVSEALKSAIGATFPAAGRSTGRAGARVVWSGAGQALILGAPMVALKGAAITDQSDGWACLALRGPGARDVLARLVPIDLRETVFKRGHAARTLLGHMPCLLLHSAADRYDMLVSRSMARTAIHELEVAMKSVAAQA